MYKGIEGHSITFLHILYWEGALWKISSHVKHYEFSKHYYTLIPFKLSDDTTPASNSNQEKATRQIYKAVNQSIGRILPSSQTEQISFLQHICVNILTNKES